METLTTFDFCYSPLFIHSLRHRVSSPYKCYPQIRILSYDKRNVMQTILLKNIPHTNPPEIYKIDSGKSIMVMDVTDKERPKLLYEFDHLVNKPSSYLIFFNISGARLEVTKVTKTIEQVRAIA